ncbi:hypothetical protein L1S34_14685, partial [Flavobacterium sp. K77]|uniref:hypothetical protein n=1 Tax=Flavobacterium sp. K77 TaxID=2910676 RepID=UPI001F423FA2
LLLMKKQTLSILLSLSALLFPFVTVLAQAEEFPEDVQDVPAAPINDWIPLLLLLAIAVAFYFFKKQHNSNKKLNKW